jgi:hypothetical protein
VSETKTRELQFALPDDLPEDNLPEPVALTPEQIAARKEAEERDQERRLEWGMVLQALDDNAMVVTRAMRQWYPREGDRERQVERVLTSYQDGSFLIDRLGAGMVVDQDRPGAAVPLSPRSDQQSLQHPPRSRHCRRAETSRTQTFRVWAEICGVAAMI